MSRIANILISTIFLISFIGINIHKHFSHGKLYSVAIFHEPETCCDNQQVCDLGSEHTSSNKHGLHCKTEIELFRIHDNFVKKEFATPVVQTVKLLFYQLTGLFSYHKTATVQQLNYYIKIPLQNTNTQTVFGVFIC